MKLFCIAKTTIQNLPTVNDHAEKGVALIQDFNCQHTANEDQVQYVLQVVEQLFKLVKDALSICATLNEMASVKS